MPNFMEELNAISEKMFKEIAASLKIGYGKAKFLRTEAYELTDNDRIFAFQTLINPDKGRISFVTKSFGQKPVLFGPYKKEEIVGRAKNEILVKVMKAKSKK